MQSTSIDRYVSRFSCACAALALVAGCQRRPRPWEGRPDGGVADGSRPFLPGEGGAGSWLGPAASAEDAGAEPEGKKVARAGGSWVSCAAGFRAGSDPKKDVERLAMLCGPENGMKRAAAWDGPAASEPDAHPLRVAAGWCYRIFAVADPGVSDLDVTVMSPRGSRLAADDTPARAVMVEPERPFCSFGDDALTVEVRAAGRGRYALQIYQLPANR